jgi:hypothetical protein
VVAMHSPSFPKAEFVGSSAIESIPPENQGREPYIWDSPALGNALIRR